MFIYNGDSVSFVIMSAAICLHVLQKPDNDDFADMSCVASQSRDLSVLCFYMNH